MEQNFRKILRDELDYQGMTVKELAIKSNVPKGAIDTYLGKQASMPPADTAIKIASALGVTVEYLVYGEKAYPESPKSFISNPRKRILLRNFDELLVEEQNLTLDFVKLIRKYRKTDINL